MKGIVAKLILYFIFSVIIFMLVGSCTKSILPPDSSQMVSTIGGMIAFVAAVVLSFIFGRKKKEPKDKK
jgi:uncharacterized membrane-anchored protein